jgi:hypothetical protein
MALSHDLNRKSQVQVNLNNVLYSFILFQAAPQKFSLSPFSSSELFPVASDFQTL